MPIGVNVKGDLFMLSFVKVVVERFDYIRVKVPQKKKLIDGGKVYSWPKEDNIHIHHIWQFFKDHPACVKMNAEELQEQDGMWYRKAAIDKARKQGCPDVLSTIPYLTKEQCIEETYQILIEQPKYVLLLNIQDLQNTVVPAIYFRKKITRAALDHIFKMRNSDSD